MRTKLLNNLNIVVGFGAHGAPYGYFCRVLKGCLKIWGKISLFSFHQRFSGSLKKLKNIQNHEIKQTTNPRLHQTKRRHRHHTPCRRICPRARF
ncbi:hypothetical protein [Alysiella crassa]|uniref:hypothetical protein n=1 Tax=Alysiella crassa TaxID=153491 RepID=UPI0011C02105|nr:hypothetical protein [Alysiella crassa]UOP06463.1 hypothetical protein LVJ80_11970 [Alysiella crassa]